MTPGYHSCTLTRLIEWSPGLRTFQFELTPPSFAPGQFFQLAHRSEAGTVKRSYSASSAPGAPLEFLISRVPEGQFTPSLFELREGDTVDALLQPQGFFTLDEVPDARVLWCVATGTGLGPYISMLRAGQIFQRFQRICLVHGVRHADDLAYREELLDYQKQQGLLYVPLVSRSAAPELGLTGRITTAVESGELEAHTQLSLDAESHILLCGHPQMIEDMAHLLKQRGLQKHRRRTPGHFSFEKYW